MKKGFFMVWREGGGVPTYQHESLDSAKKEAARLCRLHGGTFHVLKSEGTIQKIDVSWERHAHDADFDIPF